MIKKVINKTNVTAKRPVLAASICFMLAIFACFSVSPAAFAEGGNEGSNTEEKAREAKTSTGTPTTAATATVKLAPRFTPEIVAATADLNRLERLAFSTGKGVDMFNLAQWHMAHKSYKEAEKWYRKALSKGHGKAAIALYDMHKAGIIKLENPEDMKQSGLALLMEDVWKGNGGSAIALARYYTHGQYVGRNYERAYKLLLFADSKGKPAAAYELGIGYINGLYNDISPRKAVRYFEKASRAGIAKASRQVGIAYHSGIGKRKDLAKAIEYYEKAAAAGDVLAMRDLANVYKFDKHDMGKYKYWMKQALAGGDADAMYFIGMDMKKTDPALSKKYLETAMEMEHFLSRVEVDPKY